jgi:GntR family transcriptional repressor for pyruvate dehydrogenase complex
VTAIAVNAVPQFDSVVRAPKMAEMIANGLRAQIVKGELAVGSALPPEGILMAQFEVSRPTLREAFRILENESLITIKRGARGGAIVIAPDTAIAARYVGLLLQVSGTTIGDVYAARAVLEPACARLCAQHRDRVTIQRLRACADELQRLVDAGLGAVPDTNAWAKGSYKFHEALLEGCGNKTLALQAGVLQEVVAMHLSVSVARVLANPGGPAQFGKNVRSLRKLIALIEARDGAGAETHWRAHMDAAAKQILQQDMAEQRIVDLFV